ncbi:MAM and LDL-receptor class A domain-containing protein 2-like [Strongylocentrotus purpuratus]|uniref:MAM domain-containing protein n=1 Tax=Strongylocentrotus purpuratus TaxID=7668 RepID=A0A7M7NHI5_STRPU|nr:MAM and LDL-receptor class A domain-containing protein 2-like [Strongylocentrotus purpuratus]
MASPSTSSCSSSKPFSQWTVKELTDYLRKRGVTTSGYNKQKLVQLATAVADIALPQDPDLASFDSARSLREKLERAGCSFDDPMKITGYTENFERNFQCDFDEPALCGFTQDTRDDLEFLHHSGLTPTEGTGPRGDHTSGFGHYMYLEATGATFGSTARLISPRFNGSSGDDDDEGTNGVKVTFWVHKNGQEMGNLRCFLMNATTDTSTATTNTTTTMQQILEVPGVLGTEWVKKNVTIPRPSTDFHIVFEATCGASAASDIAIDDVTVNDDVIPEPAPIEEFNCTFEAAGLCVFSQDGTDQFNLVKYHAAENPNPFAMNRDHTFSNGTGQYLSVDAYSRFGWGWRRTSSRHSAGQVARLVSPMLAPVNEGEDPACLLFWYHMHGGDGVGQIRVYVKNESSEELGDPQWLLGGERGNVWRAAEIRIEQLLKFQIIFEFTAGNLENIAIDDVSLSRYDVLENVSI